MNKIVIILVDDWAVLYVNDVDCRQAHGIDVQDLVEHVPIESIKRIWADGTTLETYVHENGSFPSLLKCIEILPELSSRLV